MRLLSLLIDALADSPSHPAWCAVWTGVDAIDVRDCAKCSVRSGCITRDKIGDVFEDRNGVCMDQAEKAEEEKRQDGVHFE